MPDFSRMNETDVREMVVRPLIERLGYKHGTEATITTEKVLRYDRAFLGRKNANRDPPLVGRADYICEVVSYGRWVVEVKAPSEPLSHEVVEQAHTYASHPEVAASFFLVTNGRTFRLFQTGKLERAVLEWEFQDEDDNILRLFNTLSPAAFRKRANMTLVDPGKPLGKSLASRLRIIGGEVTYEEHSGSHPFVKASEIDGLVLPVTGGFVCRTDDKRIHGHLKLARAAPLIQGLGTTGASEDYEFYSASEFISDDPETPNIFQNFLTYSVPMGTIISVPGLARFPMPFAMSTVTYTEAIGFVREDKLVGTMSLSYDFEFSQVSSQVRMMLRHKFGEVPEKAHMMGAGRFEIWLQSEV
jgi:hypothetical protein